MKTETAQHTPGPWEEHEGFITGRFQSDGQVHDICDPRCAPADTCREEMDSNARLIVAAPDLLAALEAVLSDEDRDLCSDAEELVRAAIAKATGKGEA